MKKFLCVAASLLMAASLTACGSKDEGKKDDGKASESKADVVMITDVGTIDDKSTRVHGKVSKPMVKKPVKKLSTSNRQRNQTMPTRKLSIRLLTNTKRRLS